MTQARTKTAALLSVFAVAYAWPTQADTWNERDVVRSTSGHLVLDSRGNCVHTKWMSDKNECALQVAQGARTEIKADERTVYFEFDKATLTPEARAKLDRLSDKLKGARDIQRAEIVGFADRIGNPKYNLNLSKRRAQAVQNYLTKRGYLNTRVLEVRGVGESQSNTPCPENASREQRIACLSPDRKVEVEVIYVDTLPTAAVSPTRTYR